MSTIPSILLLAVCVGASSATWYSGDGEWAPSLVRLPRQRPDNNTPRFKPFVYKPPQSRAVVVTPSPSVVASSSSTCRTPCASAVQCGPALSCFGATATLDGCCLPTLMPNATGCLLDVQCSRACETSFCDRSQTPSRCLCPSDHHYLFKKCWRECPDFAVANHEFVNGHKRCQLTVQPELARKLMRRRKRQFESSRVFC